MENTQEMMEAAKLRLRMQMNPRLRLEVLAALARVFREYHDPVTNEVLSSLILAVPDELIGEAQPPSNGDLGASHDDAAVHALATPPPSPQSPPKLIPTPTPQIPPNLVPTPPPIIQSPPPFPGQYRALVRARRGLDTPTPVTKTPPPDPSVPRKPVPRHPREKTPPPNRKPVPHGQVEITPPPNPGSPRKSVKRVRVEKVPPPNTGKPGTKRAHKRGASVGTPPPATKPHRAKRGSGRKK